MDVKNLAPVAVKGVLNMLYFTCTCIIVVSINGDRPSCNCGTCAVCSSAWMLQNCSKLYYSMHCTITHVLYCTFHYHSAQRGALSESPRVLTITWWACYELCFWQKPTEPAHSFLFCSCVSFCVLWPFQVYFISINSPDNSQFSHSVLVVLALPYWSFQLYISLWKSPSALI